MGRIHGVIATTLALISMIFYIIGMASSSTYEYDTGNIPGPPATGPIQAYPTRLGPWSLCYRGAYENDCKVPTTKCEITYAAVPVNLKYTLPKCDNFNAYRAFIVIAFAFSVIGFLVMVYTTLRTGAWTAYYIGSTVVGISALMGLIAMAIAADYKKALEDEFNGNIAIELRYGFALPLVAWIIQIPACIIFAWTPK